MGTINANIAFTASGTRKNHLEGEREEKRDGPRTTSLNTPKFYKERGPRLRRSIQRFIRK
jgi:hypothetical protein